MIWVYVALGCAALAALLTLGPVYLVFHFIFCKPKRSPKIPKFYIDTPHYKVSRAGMALLKNLPCEDLYMDSRDGLKLHAYLFPAETPSNRYLLGIHGFHSYSRPEFGPYVEFYRSLGFNMILPDDRAHRPSEGTYIGFGVLDRLDCVDWANYIVSHYGQDAQILLHGVSMGSATVIAASGEQMLPSQVIGTVADCGYTRAWDILSYQFENQLHLPVKPYLYMVEKLCKKKAGYDFHQNAPIDQVKHAKVPILFVHGKKDPMVPCRMARELYEACSSPKRLLLAEDAGHGESIAFIPDEYHKNIRELFSL